jgi:hypothetical protein
MFDSLEAIHPGGGPLAQQALVFRSAFEPSSLP